MFINDKTLGCRFLYSVDRYFIFVLTCHKQNDIHQCIVVPKCLIQIGAEVSGHFSTGAEVSPRHYFLPKCP